MRLILTIREIMDRGLWDKFCDLRGWNPWIVNEGLAESNEDVILTDDEQRQLGLIKSDDRW